MMMKETRIIHRELLTTWWWRSAVQGDATDDFERGAARWSESRLTQRYSCRCILLQYHNECTVLEYGRLDEIDWSKSYKK